MKKFFFLKFKRWGYLNLLVLLGIIFFPLLPGCGNNKEKELQRINDSISAQNHKQDSITKIKEDSTAAALIEKLRLDSIAFTDSIAKVKKKNSNVKVKSKVLMGKYGTPTNYR